MKWAIQAKEEEKNKPQIFSTDGWTEESMIFTNVVKKWARTPPSPEPRTAWNKLSELNGSGGGRGKGIRGPRSFVPVGDTNRDKRGAFYPGWWLQPGQKPLAPLSSSLSLRPSHSAHLFLLFLAEERGVLAYFFTTFMKIFDFPVHPSALKVWDLFFSSFLACIAHFML